MRGSIRRRGANSFELRFDLERVNGKRRSRSVAFRGTFKEAQRELSRLLASADAGTLIDPSNMTRRRISQRWLDSTLTQSPKTLERYRELAEHQIAPHLGERQNTEAHARAHRAVARRAAFHRAVSTHCRPRAPRSRCGASARRRERYACPQCCGNQEAASGRTGRDRDTDAGTDCSRP